LLVFSGIAATTILRRLRKLETSGYIRRVLRLEGQEILWSVTVKGVLLVGGLPIKRNIRSDTLVHDLKLTDLRLHLEDIGVAHSWIPEHEIRSKVAFKHGLRHINERIIPDGLLGVNHHGSKESVAIELELNFKNSRRYQKTCEGYRDKNKLWGVWYVVANRGLGRAISSLWKNTPNWNPEFNFLWSLEDEVLKEGLKARVSMRGEIYRLEEIFKPESEFKSNQNLKTIPAQPPALRLSRQSELQNANIFELSTENEKEILAPAS
jgi:hypothetical protein